MAGTFDKMKGRAKEAVGDATDNKDLQREGKMDRAEGKVKEKVDKATDSVREGVDKAKRAMSRDKH